MPTDHDAIICGGGPAGLAAALWLGRYRRRTLLIDAGEQRNLSARSSHGYLTQDGTAPQVLLDMGRAELVRYDTVERQSSTVDKARGRNGTFEVEISGRLHRAKRLILATGVQDKSPDIPGFAELYGRSIFHCPCCDGYEARDENVLAIGWGEHVSGFALDLLEWGAHVTLVTDGRPFEGDDACSVALRRNNVPVLEEEVVEVLIERGEMTGALTTSGRFLPATKAFFSIAHEPRSELAKGLGCSLDELGYVKVDAKGRTSVEGVYAIGDVTPGEQMVQVAAAQGLIAAIACAQSLRGEVPIPGGPEPGPDPEKELERAQQALRQND